MVRRQFTARVYRWELRLSLLVARFGEKAVYGACVLVGALTSLLVARFGEGNSRVVCVGGSLVAALWSLALASRMFCGAACWWERSHSVLVARFGEKEACGSRVLARAKSQFFCDYLW